MQSTHTPAVTRVEQVEVAPAQITIALSVAEAAILYSLVDVLTDYNMTAGTPSPLTQEMSDTLWEMRGTVRWRLIDAGALDADTRRRHITIRGWLRNTSF